MGCLVLLVGLFFPRVVLVLVFLFTGYLGQAFDTFVWPLVGFFFLPLTTLVYTWAVVTHGRVEDLYLILVALAALYDLGFIGAGGRRGRRR